MVFVNYYKIRKKSWIRQISHLKKTIKRPKAIIDCFRSLVRLYVILFWKIEYSGNLSHLSV